MPGPHAGNRNRPAYSGQPRFRFPKQIIQLFAPRKPLEFKPPPRKPKLRPIAGLAGFVEKFTDANAPKKAKAAGGSSSTDAQSNFETPSQRRHRVQEEKRKCVSEIIKKAREAWDPDRPKSSTDRMTDVERKDSLKNSKDEKTEINSRTDDGNNQESIEKTKDPYNTIFVWNIPYSTIELRLQDIFEGFGPVRTVVMPKDRNGLPRGYAFVEFEEERDASVAIRQADGMRVDGRRIKVDVERGRTVKGWLPNRLDGPFNSCSSKRR